MADWAEVRGQTNRMKLAAAGALTESPEKVREALTRVQMAAALKERLREEQTVRSAAIRVKTQEAQAKAQSFLMGVNKASPEKAVMNLGDAFDPMEYQRGLGQTLEAEKLQAKVAEDAKKAAEMARVGPIVEKAMKGEELTGEEYALARTDVDPIITRRRDDEERKRKQMQEDAEQEVMAKYYAGGMESLSPKERATVQKNIRSEESLALQKERDELRKSEVTARLKLLDAREERATAAEERAKEAAARGDRASELSALKEARYAAQSALDELAPEDPFTRERKVPEQYGGRFRALKERIDRLADQVNRLSQNATLGATTRTAPAGNEELLKSLEAKVLDGTATEEENAEFLRLAEGK